MGGSLKFANSGMSNFELATEFVNSCNKNMLTELDYVNQFMRYFATNKFPQKLSKISHRMCVQCNIYTSVEHF